MKDHHSIHGGNGVPSGHSPGKMMLNAPGNYPWAQALAILTGTWLITTPFTMEHGSGFLFWSDITCGLIAIIIAVLSLKWKPFVSYLNSLVGLWLLIAPLMFWAPSSAEYNNDTLAAILLLSASFLIPMSMEMGGPDVPAGWSYNPSSWVQRAPAIALAFVGFFASRYMTSYQLGHISQVWDPVFSGGTKAVLESDLSRMWPVPDAGLGAVMYLVEALSGFMGDERRWRTMPWMVAIFGAAVIPLGVVSIVLIILQPLVVGAWCFLCLFSAAAMLCMIPLALDEVVAMIQFLNQSRKDGRSVWRTFWAGGEAKGVSISPVHGRVPNWSLTAMAWGASLNLALACSIGIGIWLMISPWVLEIGGRAADTNHLIGALVITFSAIALAEVGRPVRFVNALLGIGLVFSTLFSGSEAGELVILINLFAGILLISLCFSVGRIRDRYGTFQPWIFWKPFDRKNRNWRKRMREAQNQA